MTVLPWVHKLGFKWGASSAAPFCDRHEDEDVVAHRTVWVDAMLALKPRLSVFNKTTRKPEWPNLPAGDRPLLHESHDEAILYANQGNRCARVSNDSYHLEPKEEGTSIMVCGVSVACYGWLGLEMIEPKADGTWNHDKMCTKYLTSLKHNSLGVNCS